MRDLKNTRGRIGSCDERACGTVYLHCCAHITVGPSGRGLWFCIHMWNSRVEWTKWLRRWSLGDIRSEVILAVRLSLMLVQVIYVIGVSSIQHQAQSMVFP
ncbi:hypothetical protein BDB01DRAFT_840102 [Pilobolus umbonatus]|nr:hypothetical protein BDB01DRAFT_840102 [Pilobolus umbonatus]